MKQRQLFAILVAIASMTAFLSKPAVADRYYRPSPSYLPVTLTVEGDNQGSLREFPLNNDPSHYRAYIEARANERYRLRVTNNSDQRVGLVIAVDGRNIISGKKSYLSRHERMYILNPHDSADYDGWRSSTNQTNRFYFTDVSDSYAAAWGDTSAMGVIAMAVYPERQRQVYYDKDSIVYGPPAVAGKGYDRRAPAAAESSKARRSAQADAAAPAPGTGYGENSYSPVVSVQFEPSPEPMEKIVLKYEWRETLCRKNILPECTHDDDDRRENRFWNNNDDHDFAPPPPSRY